jgi:hypothetical protein
MVDRYGDSPGWSTVLETDRHSRPLWKLAGMVDRPGDGPEWSTVLKTGRNGDCSGD